MQEDARSLSPDAQAALRLRAITAIAAGMPKGVAARTFSVSRQAILNWINRSNSGEEDALSPRKRGPKNAHRKLKGWQAAIICNVIRDRNPEQLKLPFVLWTSKAIRRLIIKKFNVVLSARSVRRYLAQWGFTPQKPVRIAYERDPVTVKVWLTERYPSIRSLAKRQKARIYWGDAMGARSDHQAGRSYSPRGKTPVRLGTGYRFGANILSAITNRGDLSFMIFKRRFTSAVFIRFLRRLVKHSRRKVFLIVDGHPVHRSRKVQSWVKQNNLHLRMYFLPPYSPELNPDEMLNQDVKANAIGRKAPRDQVALMNNLRGYLTGRQKNPEKVKRYFHETSVLYASI